MIKEYEAPPGIIPLNEYKPELEKEVAYYLAMAEKPKFVSKKRYTPDKPITKFKDRREEAEYQSEMIRRLIHGYDGLSAKGYGFLHFAKLRDPEKGKISPEFRSIQEEYFQKVESIQKNPGKGIVGYKRRRVGFSWLESWDVEHDCITRPFYQVGMNSKSEADSRKLFKNVKFIHQNLPDWLRPRATASDRRDFMEFAWYDKDAVGNRIKKGIQSWISSVAPTDNAHEGEAYSKLLIDEAGKIGNLLTIWQFAEDCLKLNTRRVGIPIIMGTVGDIDKDGKGLKELYTNSDIYNLDRFTFHGYNGLIVDEFGNDMIEESIRFILYERARLKGGDRKMYLANLQKYPLCEKDAFNQATDGGVGNIMLINEQLTKLAYKPVEKVTGWMRAKPDGTVDFVPNEHGKIIVYNRPDERRVNGYVAGCLPAGEQVLTDTGLKSIESIILTDKLISKDGNPVEIKELQTYEVNDKLYTVSVKNTYRKTKFTAEHPIYVSDDTKGYTSFKKKKREGLKYSHQKFDFNFKPISEVQVGDWIKYPNVYRREVEPDLDRLWGLTERLDKYSYNDIKNPLTKEEFWWFLGLLLGDGWVTNDIITLSCNVQETITIERLRCVIEDIFNRSPQHRVRSNCLEMSFHNVQLAGFIDSHFGKYAAGKKVPEWVKYLPTNLKLALVAGYIDSDGCARTDSRRGHGSLEIVSINLELLEDFQDILFSVGVISSVSLLRNEMEATIRGQTIKQAKAYRLRAGNYWTKRLITLKCPSVKLSFLPELPETRSQNMGCFFSDEYAYIYFQILNIEKEDFIGTVYNFHCDTSTYVCRHITTHNCDPADHDEVKKTKDSSNLALAIVAKPFGTDAPKLVLEYVDRPEKLDAFFEQSAMALKWYNNTKVLVEDNRARMINYFKVKYPHLLPLVPKSIATARGGQDMKNSVKMTEERKQQMMGMIEDNVDNYVEHIPSIRLLEEFKVFGDAHADDDLAIAYGWALIMLQADKKPVTTTDQILKDQSVKLEWVKGHLVRTNHNKEIAIARKIPKHPLYG